MKRNLIINSNKLDYLHLQDFFVIDSYVKSIKILLDQSERVVHRPIIYLFKHSLELCLKFFEIINTGKFSSVHDLEVIRERALNGLDSLSLKNNQKKALRDLVKGMQDVTKEEVKNFHNFDLRILYNLATKYSLNDPKNLKFRYRLDEDFDYDESDKIIKEIKSDIIYLNKLVFMLQMIWWGDYKEWENKSKKI